MSLSACPSCRTPMRADTACPWCGHTWKKRAGKAVAGALLLATAGCVYGVPPDPPRDAGPDSGQTDAGATVDSGTDDDAGS